MRNVLCLFLIVLLISNFSLSGCAGGSRGTGVRYNRSIDPAGFENHYEDDEDQDDQSEKKQKEYRKH